MNAGSHDDGRLGEADTVTNIERVLGGAGSDTVASSPTNSELGGAAGDDMLSGGSSEAAAQSVLLADRSLKLRARRRVRATLGCPVQASQCAGTLALRPRKATGRTFASTAFRVPAGEIRTVALTLSRSAAKRVRRARRVPATLVATGGPAPVAVTVTVTR